MADFKISIDTELQTNKIDTQINEIKSRLDNAFRNIPVTFDFNTAQTSVQNLARTATEGFQNINMTVDTSQVDQAIRRLNESAQQTFNNGGGGGNNLTQQTREAGDAAHEAAEQYEELGGTFAQNTEIFNTAVQVFQSLTEQVLQMNESMIEFQKVSDLQGADLDNYIDKLQGLGDTVARTGSEMLDGANQFRKNGFNDEDSATLATLAAQFQNVADEELTAADSASFIISQMIAFGIEAENASSIIDSVNDTSNQFSVSSGDLAKALGNVASTSASMGNSMQETLGMAVKSGQVKQCEMTGKRTYCSNCALAWLPKALYTNLSW